MSPAGRSSRLTHNWSPAPGRHRILRVLRGDGGAKDSTLLLRRQRCITLLLQTSSSGPKAFTLPASSTSTIGQMLDLIQRVADVEHRNMNLLRQPLQVGQ